MMTQRREKIAQVTQKMRPNVIFCVDPKKDVIVRRSIQLGSTFSEFFSPEKKIRGFRLKLKNTFLVFVLKRLYDALDEECSIIEANKTKFPTNIDEKVTDNYSHFK